MVWITALESCETLLEERALRGGQRKLLQGLLDIFQDARDLFPDLRLFVKTIPQTLERTLSVLIQRGGELKWHLSWAAIPGRDGLTDEGGRLKPGFSPREIEKPDGVEIKRGIEHMDTGVNRGFR
jgi:hypothetical protein